MLLLFLAILTGPHAFAEGTRISPKWVRDNPGKLSLVSGSGFGGHTDYIAYLKTERKAIYEVWTKIQFVTEDQRRTPWITTKTRAGAPANSIRFGDTSYGIYVPTAPGGGFKANVIYEVYEVSVEKNASGEEEWSRNLAYTLDRSDWTSLEIASAQNKR
ncbi:hypothetical protein [Crateriforma conspicua]|uniref:hypothetical protein n=1 Tax=Crateriforma conspicua TaxID=2527996 RepID=UPI0018CF4BB7|nr:hypothetical protein [Crateriforma conspicua]